MAQVDVGSNQSIEDETGLAVEREIVRRKRLLKLYLLLLIVPVALGIIVLIFGRSDSRMVKEELQTQAPTIVQREVGEQIKPTIKSEVQSEVQSAVQAQVGPALGQLDDLKARQIKLEEDAGALNTSQQETMTALRRENEALKNEIKSELRVLDDRVAEKLNRLDAVNERLMKLERLRFEDRLNKLENRFESLTVRPGVNGFPQKDIQPRVVKPRR